MANPVVLNSDTLTCGCVIGQAIVDDHKTFFINPCDVEDCKYFQYALALAKEQGKEIEYKEKL